MQRLQQVDRMPPAQRQRTLARSEMLERLSPEEQLKINRSGTQLRRLAPQRQALVGQAFRELQSVPLNERQTVIGSARYRGMFTPEERGILTNLLRVEPYTPPR